MPDLKLKVAVSTGLYTIGRGEELATTVRKIGYALTRGSSAIELAADVPHEVNFTSGQELRYIAKKQGIDLNFHGSLTMPFTIPEMVQWREAEDHVHRSIKSAVYTGAKYIDFHACLHFWLEMMSYTSSRLEIMMGDWFGRFINKILEGSENGEIRNFFVEKYWDKYGGSILGQQTYPLEQRARTEAEIQASEEFRKKFEDQGFSGDNLARKLGEESVIKDRAERVGEIVRERLKALLKEKLREHLKSGEDWYYVAKMRGDYVDACKIIAHYLFFSQDPIWKDMVKMYEKELKPYVDKFGKIETSNKEWLWKCWDYSSEMGDKAFKEFFYGVVAAKMLWGHFIKLAHWMHETTDEFKGKGLPSIISNELKIIGPQNLEKEKKELMDVLKNLKIAVETPDARDPSHAGRYMLWRTKQIYVAIKNVRESLKKEKNPHHDKFYLLIDFEHVAGQGVDPVQEMKNATELVPDIGKLVICVHSNSPTTYHSHYPIEIGDDLVYKLLWILTEAGMGKNEVSYILFERGGFKDPFKHAVTALRLMIKFLNEGVPPDELPDEFYGVHPKGLLAEERQWVTLYMHAMDPLKGLLKIPEEDHTFLSRAAISQEGKRPEEWKKEEFR
jgi:hypothetical protein